MDALTIAIVSYGIAIIISFFVAGLIQVMGAVLSHFSRSQAKENHGTSPMNAPGTVSGGTMDATDAAIAAVIAIARNQ